jgi:hypothetical protein
MSILLMSRVFATNLQPSKKIVLLALADFANDDGRNIFPSVATIARKSSLSHRSVQSILGDFLRSGILRVIKNPLGGAPGKTRHLQIDLTALENLMRIARDENFAPVPETDADDSNGGVQTDAKTSATPAPKPSKNRHKTSTTDAPPNASRGGATEELEWPPQLDSEERNVILAVLSSISNSDQQKQFALDELRAALTRREIPRKAAWVRTILEKGIERTPAGKAYDRARNERRERNESHSLKPSEPKTEVEKTVGRERLRKMKEALKK